MNHSDLSPSHRESILKDAGRLKALTLTGLMDSPPDEDFDRLTRLTCTLLNAPVVMVTLVAGDRHYYKSMVGLNPERGKRAKWYFGEFFAPLVESC